ncbi:hypothetical protein JTE90_009874 [Oedothorax gibbosus]|uniref:Uncharacterized protein n=1 Tax=Oedothorax gibbosus TaxID=931172 RepID=A0AAV6UU20_9ARAC|nr:hypothetical protein JTE90_009874 [Oedothorax gibbosus]
MIHEKNTVEYISDFCNRKLALSHRGLCIIRVVLLLAPFSSSLESCNVCDRLNNAIHPRYEIPQDFYNSLGLEADKAGNIVFFVLVYFSKCTT